jgi:hypothetical protein
VSGANPLLEGLARTRGSCARGSATSTGSRPTCRFARSPVDSPH